MCRSTRLLAATIPLVAVLGVPAQVGAAGPAVKIVRISYDSPGADTGSNTSLNAEWVDIRNMTGSSRTITGWTLRDRTGYTYRFPTFRLAPYQTVRVHTGRGTNAQYHRYFQRSSYIWNNNYDTAYLRTSAGTLVHACSYNDGTATTQYKTC